VAISRAKGLGFPVAGPRLLEVDAKTVEHMRLANAVQGPAAQGPSRTTLFARYTLTGALCAALGSLAEVGVRFSLLAAGWGHFRRTQAAMPKRPTSWSVKESG